MMESIKIIENQQLKERKKEKEKIIKRLRRKLLKGINYEKELLKNIKIKQKNQRTTKKY